jgi:hypothetical protein
MLKSLGAGNGGSNFNFLKTAQHQQPLKVISRLVFNF